MAHSFDYVFAGGGMSASIMAYMLHKKNLGSIAIVDPQINTPADRHICFWADALPELPLTIKGKWPVMKFGGRYHSLSQQINPFFYYCFNLSDLLLQIRNELKENPNIAFFQEKALIVSDSVVELTESKTNLVAEKVLFDSIPGHLNRTDVLWQHFLGWEIETDEDAFNPREMVLMDFNTLELQKPLFMYVLPFSKKRALFECTEFSESIPSSDYYENVLKQYLLRNFPTLNYSIRAKEYGEIPMDLSLKSKNSGRRISIGTPGGAVKPTTGYTFMNTYRSSLKIISQIENQKAVKVSQTEKRFVFYDRLLLHIIRKNPEQVKPIM
jgi:lycopene beta-cyclase